MKQQFNFNTSGYETADIIIDFDDKEMLLHNRYNDLTETLNIGSNIPELKRLHKSLGNLLEEIEDEM